MSIFGRRKGERLTAERVNTAAIRIERYGIALREKIKGLTEIDDEPTTSNMFCPYASENSAAFFSAFAALKIILNYEGASSYPWKGSVYERCNELFAERMNVDLFQQSYELNRESPYPNCQYSPYAGLAIALRQYYIHWLTLAVYGYPAEDVFYSHHRRKPFFHDGPGCVGHASGIVYQFLSDMGSKSAYTRESLQSISDALFAEIYGKSLTAFNAESIANTENKSSNDKSKPGDGCVNG